MTIKNDIAQTIRELRENAGISQDKLASKADIATRHYQSIEAGDKQPTVDTIFKIAKALGVEYSDILSRVWQNWLQESA